MLWALATAGKRNSRPSAKGNANRKNRRVIPARKYIFILRSPILTLYAERAEKDSSSCKRYCSLCGYNVSQLHIAQSYYIPARPYDRCHAPIVMHLLESAHDEWRNGPDE